MRIEKQRWALFRGEATRPESSDTSRDVTGGYGIASSNVLILGGYLNLTVSSFSHMT